MFNVMESVIMKIDFDNNIKNRRNLFTEFFENDTYEVVKVL